MPPRSRTSSRRSNQPRIATWMVVVLVLILLAGYLYQEGYFGVNDEGGVVIGPPPTSTPVASLDGGAVTVYFTTPSLVYPDRRDARTRPLFEQALISDIDGAKTSVELAAFEYNLTSIADALVRAHERGVAVRLALDRENLEKPEMSAWAGTVEAAKIPIAWEDSQAFLHSKFVIIDSNMVWTGSWNPTVNDTYRNNNNLLRITVPAIVANYQAEFAQFAEGLFSTRKAVRTPNNVVNLTSYRIENYFTPQERPVKEMVEYIEGAVRSVKFMAFSYTSDAIAGAMIARQQAGIPVQGVFEQRNMNGTGSEYSALIAGGIDVLPDGNCYTMHHKVIIIDDRLVITGSYNFTGRAATTNDENVVITNEPALVRAYVEEFERVYRQAQQPTRCTG